MGLAYRHLDHLPTGLGLEPCQVDLHTKRICIHLGLLGLPARIPWSDLRACVLPAWLDREAGILLSALSHYCEQRPLVRAVQSPRCRDLLLWQLFQPGLWQSRVRILGQPKANLPSRSTFCLLQAIPRSGMGCGSSGLRALAPRRQTSCGATSCPCFSQRSQTPFGACFWRLRTRGFSQSTGKGQPEEPR